MCFTVHQGHIDRWNESAAIDKVLPDIDVNVDYIWPDSFKNKFKYGVWSIEEGGNTDRVHIQMYLQSNQVQRMSWWKKAVPGHAEIQSDNASNEQARDYCKKVGDPTFRRGPWEFGIFAGGAGARTDIEEAKAAVLAGATYEDMMLNHTNAMIKGGNYFTELIEIVRKGKVPMLGQFEFVGGNKRWHEFILFMVKQPVHVRKFYWVYDPVGNTGKSLLSKYLGDTAGAFCATEGKYADLMFAYGRMGCPGIVVMDIPRSGKVGDPHCIEDWKNGRSFSSKYKSNSLRFAPPHIICFSNDKLGQGIFSADRPVLIDLVDGEWTPESAAACVEVCPGFEI